METISAGEASLSRREVEIKDTAREGEEEKTRASIDGRKRRTGEKSRNMTRAPGRRRRSARSRAAAVVASLLASAAPSAVAPDSGPTDPDPTSPGGVPRGLHAATAEAGRSLQYNACSPPDGPPPSLSSSRDVIDAALSHIRRHRPSIEEELFRSRPFWNATYTVPSAEYRFEDFENALRYMATTGVEDDGGRGGRRRFWLGPDNCNDDGYVVGLANVAAFLGQSAATVIANDTW